MFHGKCIRKWASTNDVNLSNSQWRCPGCQFIRSSPPKVGYCFCGKTRDPFDRFLTPHSCGNPCKRKLTSNTTENVDYNCEHKCFEVCHVLLWFYY